MLNNISRHLLVLFAWLFSCFFGIAQEIKHAHSIHHSFIENKGQWPEGVLFKSHLDGGNMWIEQGRFLFHLFDYSDVHAQHHTDKVNSREPIVQQEFLELIFWGANDVKKIEKSLPTETYQNYYIGNDPKKWATDVRGYGEAVLNDFYDGIDLKLIENQFDMKYEFHVAPHVSPSTIQMQYNGHQRISIDKKGNLVVKTVLGEIVEQKPYVYQIVNGNIREVEANFKLVEPSAEYFEMNTSVTP